VNAAVTDRTALVVVLPEAEPFVSAFRARHDARMVVRRMPAHVTVLFPWVPQSELESGLRTARELFAALPTFDAALARP
jgi:hypothetical protein